MTDAPHDCELPTASMWLITEGGDVPAVCPECRTSWYPAYGWGSGDKSGWVKSDG